MLNKIRIAVDGGDYRYGESPKNGIQRWLSQGLKELERKIDYYYFNERKIEDKRINSVKLPQKGFANLFLPLNILFRKDRLFLGFSGYLPPLIKLFGVKSIIFIHDFGFYKYPRKYSNANRLIKQTESAIKQADRIVVFTKHIKTELTQKFPEAKNKMVQIYGGFDHLSTAKRKKIGYQYFLYVGVIKKTKNIEQLFNIYSLFCQCNKDAPKLMLIGRAEQDYLDFLKKMPVFPKIKNRLIFKSKVNDKELANYYSQAQALINISAEEGFCFPVGEALISGIRVIVNDLPLYYEYLPYFSNLTICHNEQEILAAMQSPRKKVSIQMDCPFTWANFRHSLAKLIQNI